MKNTDAMITKNAIDKLWNTYRDNPVPEMSFPSYLKLIIMKAKLEQQINQYNEIQKG